MSKEKVVTYYRTSTITNSEGDSKDRQRDKCLKFCKKHKFEVALETYEVISGTLLVTEREKFLEMIEFAKSNGISKIIFDDWSRFARNLLVQEQSVEYLKTIGIECIPASIGFTEDDAYADLFRNILGALSQYEHSTIIKNMGVARERIRKETGKCGGRKGLKETNPEVIKVAKRLRRKNPRTKRVRSFDKIAMELFEMGFTNSKGERYASKVVMGMCKND